MKATSFSILWAVPIHWSSIIKREWTTLKKPVHGAKLVNGRSKNLERMHQPLSRDSNFMAILSLCHIFVCLVVYLV